jgi:hypothetical protein
VQQLTILVDSWIICFMGAVMKKRAPSNASAAKLAEQARQIRALDRQVSQLTSIVRKLNRFIVSADLTLGDYELTAGEILTLEGRVKKDVAKARAEKTVKPFDGSLASLVAA